MSEVGPGRRPTTPSAPVDAVPLSNQLAQTPQFEPLLRLAAAACLVAGLLVIAWMPATASGADAPELRTLEYEIPRAQAPRDPWPDSSGGVYFSMSRADEIVRFDWASRQFREWVLPAGAKPHGVAVADDGTIFYAGYGDGSLGELDPRSGAVRRHALGRADSFPYSITLDARGNPWVSLRSGAVAMFDRKTGTVTQYAMDGDPYGLAFDGAGALWVTCLGGDKLRRLDPKTGAITELAFGKGSKPRRLSVAADGKVWVSLYGAGRLAAVDVATGKLLRLYPMPGGENSGPYSVAVGRDGRIWVTEFQTDTVAILDPATGLFRVVRLHARSGIRNASFDGFGNFWFVASASGKIGVIR